MLFHFLEFMLSFIVQLLEFQSQYNRSNLIWPPKENAPYLSQVTRPINYRHKKDITSANQTCWKYMLKQNSTSGLHQNKDQQSLKFQLEKLPQKQIFTLKL